MTAAHLARSGWRSALLALGLALAQLGLAATGDDDLLPPEVAFRFTARMLGPEQAEVRFRIADGYYMYRDKFRFPARTDGDSVGPAVLPAGTLKDDETFGQVETYRGEVVIGLPVRAPKGRRVVHPGGRIPGDPHLG